MYSPGMIFQYSELYAWISVPWRWIKVKREDERVNVGYRYASTDLLSFCEFIIFFFIKKDMRFHYLDIWKINSNHIGIHFSFLHRPFFSQYTSAHPCSLHSILSATPVQLFTTSEKRLYSSFFYEHFLLLKCQLCDFNFSFFNN